MPKNVSLWRNVKQRASNCCKSFSTVASAKRSSPSYEILTSIEQELNIQKPEDWTKITIKEIKTAANKLGKADFDLLVRQHKGSIVDTVKGKYPNIQFNNVEFALKTKKEPSESLRQLFHFLEAELKIKTPEDWLKYTNHDAETAARNKGIGKRYIYVVKRLFGGFTHSLRSMYPSMQWDSIRQERCHRGLFRDHEQQRKLFDAIGKELNITQLSDWYNFKGNEVLLAAQRIGLHRSYRSLLRTHYAQSMVAALKGAYPEYNFEETKFKVVPRRCLEDQQRLKELMKSVEQELNINSPEDWYKYGYEDALKAAEKVGKHKFLASVIKGHNTTLALFLESFYPDFKWDLLKFARIPKNTLGDAEIQQRMLRLVEEKLNISKPEDWYEISTAVALAAAKEANIGPAFYSMLCGYYSGSLKAFLRAVFPNQQWEPMKFKYLAKDVVSKLEIQRQVFKEAEKCLSISSPEDWYKITIKDILDHSKTMVPVQRLHSIISHYYRKNLMKALKTIFPEYNIEEFRATRVSKHSIHDKTLFPKIVKELEKHLYINSMEDWYRVSYEQIDNVTKLSMIKKNGGLETILPTVYPSFTWDIDRLKPEQSRPKRAQQRLLHAMVQKLLGDQVTVVEEYMSSFTYSKTLEYVQFDVYVPEYKLALEYQGVQHYKDMKSFGYFRDYALRDEEKRTISQQNGITLIEVPYTWDGTIQYVADKIQQARPDVKLQTHAV